MPGCRNVRVEKRVGFVDGRGAIGEKRCGDTGDRCFRENDERIPVIDGEQLACYPTDVLRPPIAVADDVGEVNADELHP